MVVRGQLPPTDLEVEMRLILCKEHTKKPRT